ncbi:suppressor of SWI4 1 homolog [Paramacrobiotus metropolitanus]|uniref:suppressor of SWI4 1 homolog n=1 Tax=Paramacrobiotus metropolitanus TaxID=2943436 RepID=UPI0024459A8D|nr:suppressor of SWI4 1 homolog [Paramacrobiotus metropolitanus]
MARKRKGRAAKNAKAKAAQEPDELSRAPHTFVIKRGVVGRSVNHLMLDTRKVMEPFTASDLKIGKNNVLKDFVSVAGPLHVSHMISFSRSEASPNLRIMRLPRGPTLTFRIENFSLMRDVVSSLKKAQNHPKQYDHPPLLVLNNFTTEQMQDRLTTTMLQSMFPSINVTKVKLNQVRRCVLFNQDPESGKIQFRHYNVKAVPHGISKVIKKIIRGRIPDMSRHQDISDFMEQGDNMSESEAEDNDPENKIALPQAISSRGNAPNQTSAIRLTELGPRMSLDLIKIEDGICDGEILYHKYIQKSEDEVKDQRRDRILRQTKKRDARMEQEKNVERKRQEKEEHKEECRRGIKRKFQDTPREDYDADGYRDEEMPSDDDDEAWYEEEVGEKPEAGTLGRRNIRPRGGFGVRGGRGGRGGFRNQGDRRENTGRGYPGARGRGFHGAPRGGSRGRGGRGRPPGDRPPMDEGRKPSYKAVAFRKKSSFRR